MLPSRTVLAVAICLCGFLAYTNSQEDVPGAKEALDKLSGVVDLKGLNTSALPTVEDAANLFKQKCEKNAGPNAFETADTAQKELVQCLKSLVNITKLQEDMEKYKPTGDLDEVFKEYCRKTPIFKGCVTNFTIGVEPCLDPKERENKKVMENITDSLLDFVCYKDGDRIAMFISANGLNCFESQQKGLENCVNETFSSYAPVTIPPSAFERNPILETLPSLVFGKKECTDIVRLRQCMVRELEKCEDPTTANIVESIFTFVLKVTPCNNIPNILAENAASSDPHNAAQSATLTSIAWSLSIGLLLLRVL